MKYLLHTYPKLRLIQHHYVWPLVIMAGTGILFLFMSSLAPKVEITQLILNEIITKASFAVFMLFCIFIVLISRMQSKSNLWVCSAFLFLYFSFCHDLFSYIWPMGSQEPLSWVVNIKTYPIGLIIMAVGLAMWHKEQLQLNRFLRKRGYKRLDMRLIDHCTGLLNVNFLKTYTGKELFLDKNLTMALVDIKNFSRVNHEIGFVQGDEYLLALSDLFLLNVHKDELVLRYASDKFLFIFPDSDIGVIKARMDKIINTQTDFYFYGNKSDKAINTQSRYSLIKNDKLDALLAIKFAKESLSENKQKDIAR
jgi:diguanylate cyclase (GGDEF)-like protein